MYFIWVARGLYSSMITMFTIVIKKTVIRMITLGVSTYIHTANDLKRLRKKQFYLSFIIFHENHFLSAHVKMT